MHDGKLYSLILASADQNYETSPTELIIKVSLQSGMAKKRGEVPGDTPNACRQFFEGSQVPTSLHIHMAVMPRFLITPGTTKLGL